MINQRIDRGKLQFLGIFARLFFAEYAKSMYLSTESVQDIMDRIFCTPVRFSFFVILHENFFKFL